VAWFWKKNEQPVDSIQTKPQGSSIAASDSPPLLSKSERYTPDTHTSLQTHNTLVAKGAMGLSRNTETELYQRGKRVKIPSNLNMTQWISANPGKYLFLDVGLRVVSQPEKGPGVEFSIPANTFLSPNILSNLTSFKVIADTEGHFLHLAHSEYSAASSELRLFLDQRLLEGDAALLLSVMSQYQLLEQQAYRLGDRLYKLAVTKRSKFVESDVVKDILQKIPKLPVSTPELMARLQDVDSSSAEISDLVSQDPSLTSLLLKAINSPQYALAAPVSDVSRVIVMLGYQGVYQLIMSAGLKQTLPDTGRFHDSYQKAIELSQIAFSLSALTNKGSPAVISTIALLHDLGLLVSELIKKKHAPFAGLISSVDRSEFGGELMRVWGLPTIVSGTISAQRYPDFTPPDRLPLELRDAVALLYVADQLHTKMLTATQPVPPLYMQEYLMLLGWRGKSLESIWKAKIVPHMRTRKAVLPHTLRDL